MARVNQLREMNAPYVIISPVRNEARFLEATIESVATQTVRPVVWFVVNDGSTDGTREIIDAAASKHPWIRPIHRLDRGTRVAGTGVMEAFYEAYNLLGDQPWEFLVKLDGDLTLPANYFEQCLAKFSVEPQLGIASGLICTPATNGHGAECNDPPFHVRGPAKMYRRACWSDIGGLIAAPGWDTLDLIKANMRGWRTRTFHDLKLVHHRPTGGAYGAWSNWTKNGVANYIVGYHPLFMVVKCALRAFQRPYGIGALGLLCGYCRGYMNRVDRAADQEVVRYLREQQIRCLFGKTSLWR